MTHRELRLVGCNRRDLDRSRLRRVRPAENRSRHFRDEGQPPGEPSAQFGASAQPDAGSGALVAGEFHSRSDALGSGARSVLPRSQHTRTRDDTGVVVLPRSRRGHVTIRTSVTSLSIPTPRRGSGIFSPSRFTDSLASSRRGFGYRHLPPPFAFSAGFKIDTRHLGYHRGQRSTALRDRRFTRVSLEPQSRTNGSRGATERTRTRRKNRLDAGARTHAHRPPANRPRGGDEGARREPTVARPCVTTFMHLRAPVFSLSLTPSFSKDSKIEARKGERPPTRSHCPGDRSLCLTRFD